MTEDRTALRELLEKGSDATFLREMIGFAAERNPGRTNQRTDCDRNWQTRAGNVELRIRKLRHGRTAVWQRRRRTRSFRKPTPKAYTACLLMIVAAGVNTDGRRQALGMTTGQSEAEPFWVELLRNLARRGLRAPSSSSSTRTKG